MEAREEWQIQTVYYPSGRVEQRAKRTATTKDMGKAPAIATAASRPTHWWMQTMEGARDGTP